MMFLRSIALIGFVALNGCIATAEPTTEGPAEQTEQAAKACSVRCIDGYVLTPNCTCQPACTTTALCVAGYTWDAVQCRCERNR